MTMNVTWFTSRADDGPVASDMKLFDNAIDITSSAQSVATPDNCSFVKVVCSEAAYVAYGPTVGKTPTASSTNGDYLPAGSVNWYKAVPGYKVAGIAA